MSLDLPLRVDGYTDQDDKRGRTQTLQSLYVSCLLYVNGQNRDDTNGGGTDEDETAQSFLEKLRGRSSRSDPMNCPTASSQVLGYITHGNDYGGVEERKEENEHEVEDGMFPMVVGEHV